MILGPVRCIVLCLILDSRQNLNLPQRSPSAIVLCLILDSRQNGWRIRITPIRIVLCLILDSRQNLSFGCVPRPTIVLCLILDSRQNLTRFLPSTIELYCALFWIQGKTGGFAERHNPDCTVPYFGFKAKRTSLLISTPQNCTVPYFGFKAKPDPVPSLHHRIVLCLILDSRQNWGFCWTS